MTGRVLQLAFLYTAASLLQGGKSQRIPNHHYVNDTADMFDHHNGIDTIVPSMAPQETGVHGNTAHTDHSVSLDTTNIGTQSSIPEPTSPDFTDFISSTGTTETFGNHQHGDPGGPDGPYIEDFTSGSDGTSVSSLLTDSSSSTVIVDRPSISHPVMSTPLTISIVPSDHSSSGDEMSTEDGSHSVDSGGVKTTADSTREPTGHSESTGIPSTDVSESSNGTDVSGSSETSETNVTSEMSSPYEDSTTSMFFPPSSTSLEDAVTSEPGTVTPNEPSIEDTSEHTSENTSENTSGSNVESTNTTSSGSDGGPGSETQTSHDEHTRVAPTTASHTPEVTSSRVEEPTSSQVQHEPSAESTDVTSEEPSHQPSSDTSANTSTMDYGDHSSTDTGHHPPTLSESTTTPSSEVLSSEEDRTSSDLAVSSMQTHSSEESTVSSISSISSTPSTSSESSRTLVPYAAFSVPGPSSRTRTTSETSFPRRSETTSEETSEMSFETSSGTTSEVSEEQPSVTSETRPFIRETSQTSIESSSNDAIESSTAEYSHTGDRRSTSEDVRTPSSQSISYITQYQYITATEIVTLVPSSLSMSRVVVTLSPVSTEELLSSSSGSNTVSDPGISIISSEPVYSGELLITEVLQGATVVLNHFTTVTLFSTSTIIPNSKARSEETARKNRRVGLGCGLGIGIPVLIAVVLTIYFVFIRSRRVDTIDPEGKIVTSYRMNKLKRAWYMLLGRELPDYGADVPVADLGDDESELSEGRMYSQQGGGVNRSVSDSGSGSGSWGGNAFNEKVEEPGAGVVTGATPFDSAAVPTAPTAPTDPAVAAVAAVPGPNTGFDGTRAGVGDIAGVVDDTSTVSSESFIGASPLESSPGYAGGFLYEDIPHDYYNYNHVSVNDASVERRDTDGYLSNPSRMSRAGSSGVGTGSRTGSSGRSNWGNSGNRGNQDNIFSDSHAY